MLQALQRGAGNAAAAAYIQRLAESPGPVMSAAVPPQSDPRFQAVAAQVAGQGRRLRQHPPPRAEAQQAADAAAPPATDKEAKAKASQADTMSTAEPGGFDKAGFVAAVKAAIAAQAPKNLEEAENFGKSGKAEAVKTQVAGKVTEGKKASAQDIAEKTAAAPDTSKVAEKPVTPLRPEPQPTAPRVNTAAAMPAPVPAEQTDLSGGQRETDTAMAEAGVTEQQLATSNEPEFTDALAAKKEGEEHSATAPAAFRGTEAAQLGAAKQEAQGAGAAGLAGMLATKKGTLSGAAAGKTAAKTQEEAERARIATQVKAIFDATKTDVDAILGGLDAKVDKEFSSGEAEVRKAFTADLNARMEAYKDKRYSGLEGKLRWADDLFGDLPKEADQCYVEARVVYEQKMDVLITRVADLIGTQLTAAKDRITKGRADIKAYVQAQPKNLQKLAQQAAGQFASQFDQLESDVDAKKDALVDDLATKYSESKAAVEEEITAMQEENKGLWSKAKAAVGGAIQTIIQLKDLLSSALARAAGAVGKIINDPIGFLGKFVNAVKGGIVRFGENIAEHLKAGLQGWLLGSLSAAGIELPAKLDLKGIIGLVLSLLGLTWPAIRARIARHIPEKVMSGVEKSVAFIQVILSEGVGGLWKWVVEKLGDIKEMVMGQIREFVITKIVKAGITWLISMLNPAAAFIKACKMIYDVVMFFVEKAAQIKEFVDSVLDSVESIASGGVGAVAGYIEKTLAKMVPVLLGFLAGLLGLGGISEKIKEIIATVQKPVGQVVDKLIAGAVKLGKKLVTQPGNAGKNSNSTHDVHPKISDANSPEPPVPNDSSGHALKQKALNTAHARLTGLNKLDKIRPALKNVLEELRPHGLKSISAALDANGKLVTITASASEPEEKTVRFEEVLPGIDPAIDELKELMTGRGEHPATGRSSYVVASVSVDGKILGKAFNARQKTKAEENKGEHHAEQVLVESKQFMDAVEIARKAARDGLDPTLVIMVSTSPCNKCSDRLSRELKKIKASLGKKERASISFKLLSTRVYETGDMGENWDKSKEWGTSNLAVRKLAEAGWDQSQLDVGVRNSKTIIWGQFLHKMKHFFQPA